ncbi:hypothetical protein FIBSPDRAFT_933213 [Athelia psychrophila]|uniref:Uncharacterized protein n=1 Tax=Athelia psychrophila TaxID=1759441 RepID=A0A166HF79_9AGAM|nr:hypothetical protein FIBSPDRAFT_933213 [Fibularhizoctonia sp. CBS 109695]
MTAPVRLFDRSKHAPKSSQASILPVLAPSPRRSPPPSPPRLLSALPKRYARLGSIVIWIGCALSVFYVYQWTQTPVIESKKPPLYERYHEYEAALPQHNPNLPAPEGKDAKFIWASNHVHGSGWGNAMQELLVMSHLAYVTKRSFVFDNFTWSRDDPLYSEFNGKLIPARIPLSAMITGPLNGEPFLNAPDVPRAVSRNYFMERCPEENRTYIDSDSVNDEGIRFDNAVGAQEMFDRWVERLSQMDDPCIEITQDSPQLFDIWLFGSSRILDIWPSLSKSPVLTQFGWSPLIRAAFAANMRLFEPSAPPPWLRLDWLFPSLIPVSTTPAAAALAAFSPLSLAVPEGPADPAPTTPSLLVLHIRRGDFAAHCAHLAQWSSDFNGFNKFPGLPDAFAPPADTGWGETTDAHRAEYARRCFPEIPQIVARVLEVAREWEAGGGAPLRSVYVMTNGRAEWLGELKEALLAARAWGSVASSRDLQLNWEQKYVAQTVDMMIGQRAGVFIGNGFSSLTSNVVMLRMAKNVTPESNRFW